MLPTPEEYLNNPRYVKKNKIIARQMVNIKVNRVVDEYCAEVFKDTSTGKDVHSPFSVGVVNEANYGGSVKAFAFLLTNRCRVYLLTKRGNSYPN
jgi:hypothetical protein